MTEYPSTKKTINLNNKEYYIQMITLRLQCKLEDEGVEVTYLDIINECTNIPDNILEFIPQDQLDIICEDIVNMSTLKADGKTAPKSTPKDTMSLIAWLMNKGHMDAQYYRMDFTKSVIAEMSDDAERVSSGR